jgi:hypothetical protein
MTDTTFVAPVIAYTALNRTSEIRANKATAGPDRKTTGGFRLGPGHENFLNHDPYRVIE